MTRVLNFSQLFFRGDDGDTYDGYEIVTTGGTIKFGITGESHCCEIYGLDQVPRIDILNKHITEYGLCDVDDIKLIHTNDGASCDPENCVVLRIMFSDGTQTRLCAYNMHNGYYPHDVYFERLDKTFGIHSI